jgi:hypothetical protein
MSIDHPEAPRPLPDRSNLRHLKGPSPTLKPGWCVRVEDQQTSPFFVRVPPHTDGGVTLGLNPESV